MGTKCSCNDCRRLTIIPNDPWMPQTQIWPRDARTGLFYEYDRTGFPEVPAPRQDPLQLWIRLRDK